MVLECEYAADSERSASADCDDCDDLIHVYYYSLLIWCLCMVYYVDMLLYEK